MSSDTLYAQLQPFGAVCSNVICPKASKKVEELGSFMTRQVRKMGFFLPKCSYYSPVFLLLQVDEYAVFTVRTNFFADDINYIVSSFQVKRHIACQFILFFKMYALGRNVLYISSALFFQGCHISQRVSQQISKIWFYIVCLRWTVFGLWQAFWYSE